MVYLFAFVFAFGSLVFFHEFGHFISAKLTGMKVEEFSVGFGPSVFGRQVGETLYSLRLIPLGGYNKIAGMDPDEPDDPFRGFNAKPVFSRLLVLVSGSLMNILLPIFIFCGVFVFSGTFVPSESPVIGGVLPGYSAEKAGFLSGDTILSVNNKPVSSWREIQDFVKSDGSGNLVFELQRHGVTLYKHCTSSVNSDSGEFFIGISPEYHKKKLSLPDAFVSSVKVVTKAVCEIYRSLYGMVSGKHEIRLSGPVGMAKMAGDTVSEGFDYFLIFISVLSLNLAVLNLLPLPALDGGHIVILFFEVLTGIKLGPASLRRIQQAGVLLVLTITVVATFQDFIR